MGLARRLKAIPQPDQMTTSMLADVAVGTKTCRECGDDKPIQGFDWMKVTSSGKMTIRSKCMECRQKATREWNDANREHVRARDTAWRHKKPNRKEWAKNQNLRHFFGITLADYNAMFVAQGGRCAICRTDEPGGKHNTLVVDHDHATGKIRGLLCNSCNNGLGRFKDDPLKLRMAVVYLENKGWR